MALLATIATHRVPIQPFHLRGGPRFLLTPRPPHLVLRFTRHSRPLIPAAGLCGPSPRRHNLGSCPRPSHSYFIGYTCVKFTILTRRDRAFPPTSRLCDCRLFRVSRNCGTRPCAALRSPLLPGRRGENFQITVILACKNRDEAVAAARQPCFRSSAFCCFSLLS